MRWKQGLAFIALGLTASCGGGSGGGSGTVVAPTPTPSAAPTPAPAITQYQVEGAGPVIAQVRFYPRGVVVSGGSEYSAFGTDRNGVFYQGLSSQSQIVLPYSTIPFVDDGSNAIAAFGMDKTSGLLLSQMTAPAGSTVVSPLTTLIYATADQALTKRALQLDTQSFALDDPSRDLRTFSWVRATQGANADVADARRVRAANIRLLAFLYAIQQFQYGPGYSTFYYTTFFGIDVPMLANILKANPTIRLYTNAGAEAVLRALPPNPANSGKYRDDVIAAAAHLITNYSVAIGPIQADDDIAASYMLGIQGHLLRTLWELTSANTADAAARVQAIGVSDIYPAVAPFAEHPALSPNKLFPVPDFFFVASGGTTTIPFYDPFSNSSVSLASNDMTWFVQPDGYPLSLVGVTVPPRFEPAISVTPQTGGALSIQAKAGFSGVAWFDYEVRTPGGISASSRAYVVVK
jgi:hypothetical protein